MYRFAVVCVLLLMVVMAMSVSVALAQEATPELTPTPPPPVSPPATDGSQAINLITLISGIGIGVVTGGGGVLLTVLFVVNKVRNDKALLTAIEGLTNSIPVDKRQLGGKIGQGLQELGEIVEEVFDDVPVTQKPD